MMGSLVANKSDERTITNSYPTNELAVANWFLARAASEGRTLTHESLQAFVQLAYGWYFASYHVPLYAATPVAKAMGPVLPTLAAVYEDTYASVGNGSLRIFQDGKVEVLDFQIDMPEDKLTQLSKEDQERHKEATKQIKDVLEIIWLAYRDFTPKRLCFCLCMQGTPWEKIYLQTGGRGANVLISREEIHDYFLAIWEQSRKQVNKK